MKVHMVTNEKLKITSVSGIYDSYLLLFGKRKIQSFEILCK